MTRGCPLCSSASDGVSFPYATTWNDTTFTYRRCAGCRAVFVDPLPTSSQLVATYDWHEYHEIEYGSVDHERYAATSRRLAELRAPAVTKVLDFGCGAGGFLRAASAAGFDVHGVELTREIADAAARATRLPVGTLDDIEAIGATFDVVVMRDVLAHLPEPVEDLQRLEQRLVRGGIFFFDGPLDEGRSAVRSVAGGLKAVRRRLGQDTPSRFAPTMLVRVDAVALRRFLTMRMGYEEELFDVYETGWPYHVPGRRPSTPVIAAKEAIGWIARAMSHVGDFGNRFVGAYRPGR